MTPAGQDGREESGLTVHGQSGEYVEVMHGDRCVALTLTDDGGAFAAGVVLTPEAARRLAVLLREQARSSERSS